MNQDKCQREDQEIKKRSEKIDLARSTSEIENYYFSIGVREGASDRINRKEGGNVQGAGYEA